MKKLPKINSAQAAVLIAVIGGAVAVVLWAPPDFRAPLVAIATALAGFLRSPASDED